MSNIKDNIKRTLAYVNNYSARKQLKNRNFTIISNNCWGGFVSMDLGVPYNSPFVGLFLFAPDYIKLLKDLEGYMNSELAFTRDSRYKDKLIEDGLLGTYPIGLLKDVEIHFLHYKSEAEAKEKWERRTKRINWDNLYVKFCDRDLFTYDLLEEFDRLGYRKKVAFTAKPYDHIAASVQMKEFERETCVDNEGKVYKKYFNVVEWLNT